MQRHHIGSGRRRAIPLDWSEHHRGVLVGTRDATVTLRRPGGVKGAFDQVTGTWSVTPHPPYFGAGATEPNARIQVLADSAQIANAAEQEVSTLRYRVTLDHAVTGIELEDVCTVIAVDDNGDGGLVERELVVDAIHRGSLHWERVLTCIDNLETPS